ncbi:MAG: patatin-like phospholipase family protein [Phycisphaeraceae bacterium]|nr:patatin-like phospholipase family protein [Phycisphaeraceae bacterium]
MKKQDQLSPKRRILSIDGGGILGTFPAAFLAGLEQHLPRPIGSYFDLIAGTSTGGIIAIGLAMGLTASELLELYEKRGPEIFGDGRGRFSDSVFRLLRAVRWSYRTKHDPGPLRAVLNDVLGDRRIGDAQTRLLIPAWNPVARSVYIYKTAHHPRLRNDYKSTAVDAALATAAAPTYFPHHMTQHAVGLVDGGVWANNPTALAVVEAITLLGWPANSLHILSIGCLEEAYAIPKWAGFGTLGPKAIKLFMDGQSRGAMGIAKLLTAHEHERTAIYRINHVVPHNTYKMDDTRVLQDLKGLGYSFARDRQPILDPVFFDTPAEGFIPVHTLYEHAPPNNQQRLTS